MRKSIAWLPLLLVLFWPQHVQAIVNVDDTMIGEPAEGISGRVNLAVGGASGNTDKVDGEADLQLQLRKGRYTNILAASYAYKKSQGTLDTNKAFLHLRHRIQFVSRWAVEGYVQAERDPFARLARRTLAGAGLRWTMLEEAGKSAAYLGLGGLYERDRLSLVSGSTDPRNTKAWRVGSYLTLKYSLNEQARLLSTTFYQPRMSDVADFRLLEEAAVKVRLYENVDVTFALQVRHDSQPPQQVKQTDVTYTSGLEFRF